MSILTLLALVTAGATAAGRADPFELMSFEGYMVRFGKEYPGNLSVARQQHFYVSASIPPSIRTPLIDMRHGGRHATVHPAGFLF